MRAVILAGGSGTRLWPLSRDLLPKQFLALLGERTLLQETLARVRPLVGDSLCVVTGADTAHLVAEQLSDLGIDPVGRVLGEPVGRNTAPAIAVAALAAAPGEILVVLPSDHAIRAPEVFRDGLRRAAAVAEAGYLVTFAIQPSGPETGYGYIESGEPLPGFPGFHRVARFVEKPDRATAESYLRAGGYAWNSGMFAFRADTFLAQLSQHAPDVFAAVQELRGPLAAGEPLPREAYAAVPKISVDYAVLERSDRVAVLPMDPGWSDLGSFAALHDLAERDPDGNAVRAGEGAEVVLVEARDTLVLAGKRVVAVVGVADTLVVDSDDALLVCTRERAQDVREVVDRLRAQGRAEVSVHRTARRPWGSYTVLDEGAGFKVKRIEVKPGARLSLQLHRRRSEHWVVVAGRARVTRGEETLDLQPGETVFVPVETAHRLENPGSVPLQLVEVQSGDYLGEDDIVRLQDDYGRAG